MELPMNSVVPEFMGKVKKPLCTLRLCERKKVLLCCYCGAKVWYFQKTVDKISSKFKNEKKEASQ